MRYLLVLLLLLSCSACVSTPQSHTSTAELRAIGRQKFGHDRFVIANIPGSKGPVTEGVTASLGTVAGPSSLIRDTASNLRKAHGMGAAVLFTGESPQKTERVLLESLAILPSSSLAGLKVYAVGIETPELRQAAQRAGATLMR